MNLFGSECQESEIMTKNYVQCRLQKENTHTTSWIPEQFATLNRIVKIKKDEEWNGGWKVTFVGSKLEAKYIENQAHNAKEIWTVTSGSCPRGNK